MDQPPPINHDAAKDILSSVGTWIMWFISSIISGSVSAIMRAGTAKVAAYWVVLSAMIGPGLAVITVRYWNANVFEGAVVCLAVGLMIAGIARQIEKLNGRVGAANINIPMLAPEAGIVTPEQEPTSPSQEVPPSKET